MSLRVCSPGVCATVQDGGRPGYRNWGVPPGGAFDRRSLVLANVLIGNPPETAALELTLLGGEYEATDRLAIALAGAPMRARIVGRDQHARNLDVPQTATLEPGERLILGASAWGARTYLAVKGGWRTPVWLGSRSREERLQPGDVLRADRSATPSRRFPQETLELPASRPIRILAGPDAGPGLDPGMLTGLEFQVGPQSDRVGLRLEGPPLTIEPLPDRVSTPFAPGAVQVTGQTLILLGVACGTMGGYTHLAHVISADLDCLGQLRPGDPVRFELVGLDAAHRLDRATLAETARHLRTLATLTALPPDN